MSTFKGIRLKFSIWCDVSFALAYITSAIVICVVVDCPRTVQATDPDVVSVDYQNQLSEHHQTRKDDEEVVNGRNAENLKLLKRFDINSDFNSFPYDSINRILRDEDPESIHVEQHFRRRWKRLARPHRMSKRSAIFNLTEKWTNSSLVNIQTIHNTDSSYSTKSIELVNRGLNEFHLEQLNISDFSQITFLNLTNNNINDLSMATLLCNMVNLQQLDLAINHIQSFTLGISSNKVLENHILEINLSCNNVSNFEVLIPDAKLRRLYLNNNRMREITPVMEIVKPNNLEVLDLSCNQIAELDRKLMANLTALKRLNLSWNKLRTIPKGSFDNLLHINTLVLSHNDISSVEYESFLVLPNLQHLDLSHNKIQADSIRALQGIPRLVSLSIAFNRNLGDSLQEFVASWSLKELDISGTGLCRIPAALAQSVRTLTAVDNWFSIIRCGDLDSYPLLQYLDLSSSHIDEIEEDALGRLEILQTLFLDHNNLKRIPVSLPTSLENLFLHNNQIMEVQQQTFQQLYNLKSLDLSGNKLMYLPGLPLPKLLTLNLQSSELRGLSQSVVKTSPRLRDLLLEGNPIKCHDLLGIAEWVGLCRNDRIKEQRQDIKKKFLETHNYLEDFQKNHCLCEHAEVEHVETKRLNRQNCSTTKTLRGDSQNVKTKSSLKRLTKHALLFTLLSGPESQKPISNSTKFLAMPNVTGSGPTMTIPIQNTSRTIQSISNYPRIQDVANIATNSTKGGPVPNEPVLKLSVSMSQVNDAKIPTLPPQKIESPMSGQEIRIHQDNYNIQHTSWILPKAANSKKETETLSNITEIFPTPMQKHPEANDTKFKKLPKESIDLSTSSEDISLQNFYQDNGEDLLTTINSNEIQTQISSTSELLSTEMSELSDKTITSKANKTEKTICLNESSNVNENGIIKLNDTISWTKQHKQDERDQNMKEKISVVYKIQDISEKTPLKKTLKKLSVYTTTTKAKRYSASEGYARIKMNENDKHLNVKISNQNAHKTVNKDKLHLLNQLELSTYGFVATTARPTSASQKELDVESVTLKGRDTISVHFTLNTPKDQPINVVNEFGQISSRKNDEIDIENSAFIATLAARTKSSMMVDDDNQINIKLATINQIEEGGNSSTGTDNMTQTLHNYQLNTSGDGYPSRYDNNHTDNPDNINHNNTSVSNIHNSFNAGTGTNRSKTQSSIGIIANSSTSSSVSNNIGVGLPPEQLTGIRTSTGHPGLLIVIGVTFGMILTLGLIHIYRCKKPWYHHSHSHRHLNHPLRKNSTQINDANYSVEDDCYIKIDQESQPSVRRHLLPMELLSTSNLRYNNNNNNNNVINNNNNNLSKNYTRHYNIHNSNINTNRNIHTSTDNENLHPIGLW